MTSDQLAQISPSAVVDFYLTMSPPQNTHRDEAELVSVLSDQEQALESMYVDTFCGFHNIDANRT